MLKGIHFLLTYVCNYSCDHCFLYCSPKSKGTFTLTQIKRVLDEAMKIKTVEWIYFEGGEPFLYYPIMIKGLKLARDLGFKTGLVSNSYWATSVEDAEIWLKPISKMGISDFSISNDTFHYREEELNLSKRAEQAARNLNLPSYSISIDKPSIEMGIDKDHEKGEPVIKGGAMFRGRAVEMLTEGLPRRSWEDLNKCPYEDLEGLGRIHIDPFGNAQICQGLSIGNFWKTPLSELIDNYNANSHPICGPLIQGGPAELVREYKTEHEDGYVDECHLCYLTRLKLLEKFPEYLAPRQVYGLDE
ncbi:MAG: radical SAM protein [Candidatus Thorarchaeota archaeon]